MLDRRTFLRGAGAGVVAMGLGLTPSAAEARAVTAERLRRLVYNMAVKRRMPASLVLAVAHVESGFRNDYEGPGGGRGLMQILPEQAVAEGVHPDDLWFAKPNVKVGMALLKQALVAHDGKWRPALADYARGIYDRDSVEETLLAPRVQGPIRRYVVDVLRAERRYAERIAFRDLTRRERTARQLRASGARLRNRRSGGF